MTECIDLSKFPSKKQAKFNGNIIAPNMPPPMVTITENIDGGNCAGYDASKTVTISIEGELACCDSDEKIAARESLLSAFSDSCGDFEIDGEIFEDAKVQSLDISQSGYQPNVPYTVQLVWVDPDFGAAKSGISSPSSVITTTEDDEKVTVSHKVSASAAENTDCADCNCDITPVSTWVTANISSSAPSALQQISQKNQSGNTLNCPNINEDIDLAACTHSLEKIWVVAKDGAVVDDDDGNNNVQTTRCVTTSQGRNQKTTITKSGTITYIGGTTSCSSDPSDPSFRTAVDTVLEAELSNINASGATSLSTTKSENPISASYNAVFEPNPDGDTRGKTIDEYCVSGSIGSDGVISITVSGSLRANDNYPYNTKSRQCKCEAIAEVWDPSKYHGIAKEYYSTIKSYIPDDILKKLAGPCNAASQLNPNPTRSSVKDAIDQSCTKSYSYNYDDKTQKDTEWNYSANINHKRSSLSVQPLLNGKFCVIRGDEQPGSITINGQRSQDCPDDPAWDLDQVAEDFAQALLPDETLREDDKNKFCTETKVFNVGAKTSSFSKTYAFGGEGEE